MNAVPIGPLVKSIAPPQGGVWMQSRSVPSEVQSAPWQTGHTDSGGHGITFSYRTVNAADQKTYMQLYANDQYLTFVNGKFSATMLSGVPSGFGDAASDAATAMNNALLAHGYKQADMGLYQAFQSSQGLVDDGYPGTNTMTALKDVLFQNGSVEIAPVTVYPWLSQANYGQYPWDGINAPTMAEWDPGSSGGGGGGTVVTPTVVVPGTVPASSSTGMSQNAKLALIGAGLLGAGIIGYALYRRNKKVRVVHLRRV